MSVSLPRRIDGGRCQGQLGRQTVHQARRLDSACPQVRVEILRIAVLPGHVQDPQAKQHLSRVASSPYHHQCSQGPAIHWANQRRLVALRQRLQLVWNLQDSLQHLKISRTSGDRSSSHQTGLQRTLLRCWPCSPRQKRGVGALTIGTGLSKPWTIALLGEPTRDSASRSVSTETCIGPNPPSKTQTRSVILVSLAQSREVCASMCLLLGLIPVLTYGTGRRSVGV